MSASPIRRRLVHALALLAAFNVGLFARPYIDGLRERDALHVLESAARIRQGGLASAPRLIVAFDAYCEHCHELYATLLKGVEAGEVQVEWVPVAFMNGQSARAGALMLTAADPSLALSRWFGAAPGDAPPVTPKGAQLSEAEAQVQSNTTLLRALLGRDAVPAVFYRDRSGATQATIGVPADTAAWLKRVSG